MIPSLRPHPEKNEFLFFLGEGEIDWKKKSNMFHLRFWYMAFSNLGSHNVLGPSWHQVALAISFVLPNHFLVFKNFLILLQPAFDFDLLFFLFVTRLPSFFSLLSWHQPFLLGGRVLGKRPHDLSGSTQCLRYPASFACIPQTITLIPIYCSKSLLSWWDCVYLSLKPYLSWMSLSAFKILPFSLPSIL